MLIRIFIFLLTISSLSATFREHERFTAGKVDAHVVTMVKDATRLEGKSLQINFEKLRGFGVSVNKREKVYEVTFMTRNESTTSDKGDTQYRKTIDFVKVKDAKKVEHLTELQFSSLEKLLGGALTEFTVTNKVEVKGKKVIRSWQTITARIPIEDDVIVFITKYFKTFPADTPLYEDGPW